MLAKKLIFALAFVHMNIYHPYAGLHTSAALEISNHHQLPEDSTSRQLYEYIWEVHLSFDRHSCLGSLLAEGCLEDLPKKGCVRN